ncbi:MAG: hypothetical protein K2Y29_21480 [Beijerinckiaceae bacterium]|nr:hypothetical protein [Beijerinckiaceae bacterium]
MKLLLEGSLKDIRAAICERRVSAVDVARFFVARIEAFDRAGPHYNCVRAIAPDVDAQAARLDDSIRNGEEPGPLHGIPILIEDNVAVAGMPMSAGCAALKTFIPAKDASLVRKLREAGAIILGKTNLTEFADYVSDVMPSSFSGVAGHVNNPLTGEPYARGEGSSVGSAAAVAAGLAPVAIGSETQNSIQTPACMSSIVGFKPSVAAVSRAGVLPLVPSQDSPGVLARSIADAAAVFAVLSGADMADTATLEAVPLIRRQATDLTSLSLGVPRITVFDRPELEAALPPFLQCLDTLRATGVRIVDPCDLPAAQQLRDVRSSVFPTEFKAALEAFLKGAGHPCEIASLSDLIAWNAARPHAIPYGQSLLINAANTGGLASTSYLDDRRRDIELSRAQGIDAAIDTHGVDALIVPMSAGARWSGKSGAPVIALPVGADASGKPFGVTLIGPRFDDAKLILIAARVEKIIARRMQPLAEDRPA